MPKEHSQENNSQRIISATDDVALRLFLNARGFDLTARIVNGHQQHKSLLMWPTIANETFALELHLKCLYKIRGQKCWGHDTKALFDKLSKSDQMTIDSYLLEIVRHHPNYSEMCERGVRFDADFVAQRASNAFEKARYWWEGNLPEADSEGFTTTAGVGNLCDAIRKLILELNPTWSDQEKKFRFVLPGQFRLPT